MRLSLDSHQNLGLFCLVMLLFAFASGVTSHDSKKSICCKELMKNKVKSNITKCYHVSATSKCLEAVILGDNRKMYCFDPKAPWLNEFLEEKGIKCHDKRKVFTP